MPQSNQLFTASFLNYLQFQKRYSPNTIISYQNDLSGFFDFIEIRFGNTLLPDIKAAFVKSWLVSLKESGMESKSLNRKISCLKSFFKYQLKQGVLATSPMISIISPKIKKRLPQFVAENDIKTLFDHVEFPDAWEGKTHRLILQLLYATGMRKAELINLRESHIDKSNHQIKVLGKGNKERILPVNHKIMQLIQDYMDSKKAHFQLFDSEILLINLKGKKLDPKYVYNVVRKYLSQVTTIDKKSPHVLRHSFATHLMSHGADLNAVKELLGHSSLAATQIYTHNSIEKLKDIHKLAHPKA